MTTSLAYATLPVMSDPDATLAALIHLVYGHEAGTSLAEWLRVEPDVGRRLAGAALDARVIAEMRAVRKDERAC